MARTQKNKATMGHLGLLKARLAKLRRELIEPKGGGGGTGEGFDVAKTGDARIGFVGQYALIGLIISTVEVSFSLRSFVGLFLNEIAQKLCMDFREIFDKSSGIGTRHIWLLFH